MNENTTFCFKNFQDTIVRASTPVVEKEKEQRLDQGKERKETKGISKIKERWFYPTTRKTKPNNI